MFICGPYSITFVHSLRSEANVTTPATNKQYAFQNSCYCLIIVTSNNHSRVVFERHGREEPERLYGVACARLYTKLNIEREKISMR